jgi:GntR family transcriptional regulator
VSDEASLPRVGQGSLTEQTTRALLDAILERRFPDDRLPAEPELAETLNVSRTTIRAALQSLERLGMLSRTPGRGTVIRAHVGRQSIVLQRIISFHDLLSKDYADVQVKGQCWLEPGPTQEAADELNISIDTPVIKTSKTFLANGSTALHIRDQIPLAYVSPATQKTLLDGQKFENFEPILAFSRTWPGREIDHALVEIVACIVPDDPDFPLDLPPGSAHIMLAETHYTALGEPVAFTEIIVDDSFVRFHVVRHH